MGSVQVESDVGANSLKFTISGASVFTQVTRELVLARVLGSAILILALERLLSRVCTLVDDQFVLAREAVVTRGAFVGLLACVLANVDDQAVLPCEEVGAVWAGEGLLSRVVAQVYN